MEALTTDEALAFVEAMRLQLTGKVGFSWLTDRLSGLTAAIEGLAQRNARLEAFIDAKGLRGELDAAG